MSTRKEDRWCKRSLLCFPFTYGGVSYSSCTTVGNGNRPSCSFDAVCRGQWANCGKRRIRLQLEKDVINSFQNCFYNLEATQTADKFYCHLSACPLSVFIVKIPYCNFTTATLSAFRIDGKT